MSHKYKINITPEVLEVLQASIFEGNSLVLPPGQLERKLYESVNKVLAAAGGKWNRGAKAHIFPDDPRERLGIAVTTGKIIDTVEFRKKELNAFYTPPAIAGIAASYLQIGEGATVLEPSAGGGNLVFAAIEVGADVTCIEIDPDCCEQLRGYGFEEFNFDFLKVTPKQIGDLTGQNPKGGLFDAILMNPPFSKGRDVDHVTHALKFLKRGGRLVSIIGKAMLHRDDARYAAFQETFTAHNGQIVEWLPEGTFRESGTNIETLIITLEK